MAKIGDVKIKIEGIDFLKDSRLYYCANVYCKYNLSRSSLGDIGCSFKSISLDKNGHCDLMEQIE